MAIRCKSSKAGYALPAVLILAFAMGIIGMSFISMAGHETRQSQGELDSQRAFWLAEAGKERALRWMATRFRPPDTDETIYQGIADAGGGTYSVEVVVDTSTLYSNTKGFMLEAVGNTGNRERRIRQRIRMLSFAQYAYFTDDERTRGGTNIWFIGADQIHGRIHTNGTFRIYGSPTFHGKVTSASDRMVGYPYYYVYGPDGWPIGGNNPQFMDGFTLNEPTIPLPTQTLDLRGESLSGGIYLPATSEVELGRSGAGAGVANPGWLRHRNPPPAADTLWVSVDLTTVANPVLYCEGELRIQGELDGELTAASNRDIVITDDVVYAGSNAAGAPLPGCDDLLGLVAGKNIVFDYNPPVTNNLKVNAILMALDTSITAEDYNNWVVRGTLTIHGGMIQKYRGPVGLVSWGMIVSGYQKDYHYDSRVTGRTPPAFPLTGVYEKVAWSESWDERYPF